MTRAFWQRPSVAFSPARRLDLHPFPAAARGIGRVTALGNHPLKPECLGGFEERTAVWEVFAKHQAGQCGSGQGLGEPVLALLEGKLPRVAAVAVEQVKGPIDQVGIITRCGPHQGGKVGLAIWTMVRQRAGRIS